MKKYNSLIQLLRSNSAESELSKDRQQKIFRQISSTLRPHKHKRWPKLSLFFKSLAFAVFLLVITSALVLVQKPNKMEQSKKEEILAKLQLVQQVNAATSSDPNPYKRFSLTGKLYTEETTTEYVDAYVCNELLVGNTIYKDGYAPQGTYPITTILHMYTNYDGAINFSRSYEGDSQNINQLNYSDNEVGYNYSGGEYAIRFEHTAEEIAENLQHLRESIDNQRESDASTDEIILEESEEFYTQFEEIGGGVYKITYFSKGSCKEGDRFEVIHYDELNQSLRFESYVNSIADENKFYASSSKFWYKDSTYNEALSEIKSELLLPEDIEIKVFQQPVAAYPREPYVNNDTRRASAIQALKDFHFPVLLNESSEYYLKNVDFASWLYQYISFLYEPAYMHDPLFYPEADRPFVKGITPIYMTFKGLDSKVTEYHDMDSFLANTVQSSWQYIKLGENYDTNNFNAFNIYTFTDKITINDGTLDIGFIMEDIEYKYDIFLNIDDKPVAFQVYEGSQPINGPRELFLLGEFAPGYQASFWLRGDEIKISDLTELDFTVKNSASAADLEYLVQQVTAAFP